jgi:hypothetical protein
MSIKMKPDDPAYWMLFDGFETIPVVYREGCYICEDPEFAQMGLPLCRKCPVCGGHVAADDYRCDDCGLDEQAFWEAMRDGSLDVAVLSGQLFINDEYEAVVPTDRQVKLLAEAIVRIERGEDA